MEQAKGYRGHVSHLEGIVVVGLLAIWSVSSMVLVGLHNGLAA